MVFGSAYHYEDDAGELQDIDLNWRDDGAGDAITDRHDLHTRITRFGVAIWDRRTSSGIRWSAANRPDHNGRRATMPKDGLTWTYSTTIGGLKLESEPVREPRGPRVYEWRYLIVDHNRIDGFDLSRTLMEQPDGSLLGDGFAVPRAFVIGANRERYACGPWQVGNGRRASFAFDDSVLPPEAFPYVIDPSTTFSVTAGADDLYTRATQGVAWPITGNITLNNGLTTVLVGRRYSGGGYYVENGLVRWDTSGVPDAISVSSALVRVRITAISNADNSNVTGDWHNWYPAGTEDWVLESQSGAITAKAISSLTNSALNDLTVSDYAGINTTGYTELRLHVDGGQPTGNNYIIFAANEDSSLPEPQLIVEYTEGGGTPEPTTITCDVRRTVCTTALVQTDSKRKTRATVTANTDTTRTTTVADTVTGDTRMTVHSALTMAADSLRLVWSTATTTADTIRQVLAHVTETITGDTFRRVRAEDTAATDTIRSVRTQAEETATTDTRRAVQVTDDFSGDTHRTTRAADTTAGDTSRRTRTTVTTQADTTRKTTVTDTFAADAKRRVTLLETIQATATRTVQTIATITAATVRRTNVIATTLADTLRRLVPPALGNVLRTILLNPRLQIRYEGTTVTTTPLSPAVEVKTVSGTKFLAGSIREISVQVVPGRTGATIPTGITATWTLTSKTTGQQVQNGTATVDGTLVTALVDLTTAGVYELEFTILAGAETIKHRIPVQAV